ncbi:1848_t:CDS:10 [Acaulospora morrowiae]|uniref:1848_t:CDS:1 n=1 Tax=Acaulospora morrowiae TaxID=94023 RepID=A0A9N9FMK2_9GLOM|nr:1848_t:CDS:10 [Acaulospora morrowiae]
MSLNSSVKPLELAKSEIDSEFGIKFQKLIKEKMSSSTNQQLLAFTLIPIVLGAYYVGISSLVSIFGPPYAFHKLSSSIVVVPLCLFVIAYGTTWMFYLLFAQHDREFFLPYEPQRIIKFNLLFFNMLLGLRIHISLFSEYVYLNLFVLGKEIKYVAKKDIPYGSRVMTNKIDVYMPETSTKSVKAARHPVIVFIYGGAWSSGNKLTYTLLALRLTQLGYVVVVPNYTLYPKTKIEGMLSDIKRALCWTKQNISDFGGDPNNIYGMGHSAGAHMLALLTANDAIYKLRNNEEKADPTLQDIDPEWTLPKISGLILMSGVYDIPKHYKFEAHKAVEEISAMRRAMGWSKESLVRNSPKLLIQNLVESKEVDVCQLKNLMPQKILIIHGELDTMVPVQASIEFGSVLKDLSIENLNIKIYPDMAHSEPVTNFMKKLKFTTALSSDLTDFIAS